MAIMETWSEGQDQFKIGVYARTDSGTAELQTEQAQQREPGYVVIATQTTDGSWDLAESAARSAVVIGLAAITGFGFVSAKKQAGSIVVGYQKLYLSAAEAAEVQRLEAEHA